MTPKNREEGEACGNCRLFTPVPADVPRPAGQPADIDGKCGFKSRDGFPRWTFETNWCDQYRPKEKKDE